MAGRHSKRPGLHVRIPEQSFSRPVGIVDSHTRVEHVVAGDVVAPHRLSYLAKCGAEILAASLTDPGRARCAQCAR
jgi:hypothetical protein